MRVPLPSPIHTNNGDDAKTGPPGFQLTLASLCPISRCDLEGVESRPARVCPHTCPAEQPGAATLLALSLNHRGKDCSESRVHPLFMSRRPCPGWS